MSETQEELKKLTLEERQDRELNICDKCGYIESTYELVWITPDEDNEHPAYIHDKGYDALCADCYAKLLNK